MSGELDDLAVRLQEFLGAIYQAEMALELLDQRLEPYWYAKGEIDHKIKLTHHRHRDGAIKFNPEGAAARVPLFEDLMLLAIEWGPVKADRNQLKTRLSGYEREAKKIRTEIKYLRRKEARHV